MGAWLLYGGRGGLGYFPFETRLPAGLGAFVTFATFHGYLLLNLRGWVHFWMNTPKREGRQDNPACRAVCEGEDYAGLEGDRGQAHGDGLSLA